MEIKTIELTSRTWRRIRRRFRRQRQQAKRKPESVPELVSDITAEQLRAYMILCDERFGDTWRVHLGEKK